MTEATKFAPLPAVGEAIAGKYRIEALIGHGAMGVVYRARHDVTRKRVAVKVLQPHVAKNKSIASRFLQEARASSRIAHRNIVDTFDAGEWNGVPFLVMELLRGEPLSEMLRRSGRLGIETTMSILGPVCRAVHAAHRAGVIHRDLKPDNIFICREEGSDVVVPKVVDFGVSKIDDPEGGNMTATGHAIGTALYMPLEQMFGARDVKPASDVYAIGVIIYECLTAQHPYEASSLPELAVKMSANPPVPIDERRPDLPPSFCAALMRALEKDLSVRYRDVPEMMAAFAEWGLGGHGSSDLSGEHARLSVSGEVPAWTQSELQRTLPIDSSPAFESDLVDRPVSEVRRAPEPLAPAARDPLPATRSRGWRALLVPAALAVVGAVFYVARPERPPAVAVPTAAQPSAAESRVARLRVHAPGRAGAELRVDGVARGRLDGRGELELVLPEGERFIELVVEGLVVTSRASTLRGGAADELTFEAPAPNPSTQASLVDGAVPAASGAVAPTSRPASRTRRDTTPTPSVDSGRMSSIRLRGDFEVDPY